MRMRWATTRDRVLAVVLAVVVTGAAGCGLAGRRDGVPDRAGDPGNGGDVGGELGVGHGEGHDEGHGYGGPGRGRLDDPKAPRGAVQATVIRVIDGDTLAADLRGRAERIRLIGVDAPETATRTERMECHGHRATLALRRLAGRGTSVRLAYDRERRDRYGRRLSYAWTADGVFVNAALIRGGHARPMPVAPNDRYAALFRAAGRRAWIAGSGLWTRCEPPRAVPDG
jgi:endonuclease YncB( thermonuclease family)